MNMFNRRQLLVGTVGAGALALLRTPTLAADNLPNLSAETSCWNPPVIDEPRKPEIASSLRRLLADAATGKKPSLKMTRMDGYVVDDGDVLLWGRIEAGEKELELDDMVVAIRSAQNLYERSDHPSVSLEDEGLWVAKTDFAPAHAITASEQRHAVIALDGYRGWNAEPKYREICKKHSNFARIWGMPKDSRVAKALLDADYRMKTTFTGVYKLKIKDPFPAPTGLNGTKIQALLKDDRRFNAKEEEGTRFWFNPGKVSYVRDGGSVFMDCVQVVLRTAVQSGEGHDKKYSEDFACSWTNRMEEVVRSEHIWRDMVNQFRHFSIARTMVNDGNGYALADPALAEALRSYVVAEVSVPKQYPALSFVARSKGRAFFMCGGVVVPAKATKTADVSDKTRTALRAASEVVVASSRSCTESCWDIA
jgi:hypothetical protein